MILLRMMWLCLRMLLDQMIPSREKTKVKRKTEGTSSSDANRFEKVIVASVCMQVREL